MPINAERGRGIIEGGRLVMRSYREDDRGALEGIIDSSFRHGIYTFFAKRSLRTAPRIIVCEIDGKPAGFAEPKSAQVGKRKIGNILWIAVDQESRRKGVASALVAECVRILAEQGVPDIFVSVENDNPAGLALFEKEGFQRKGSEELRKEFRLRLFSFYMKLLIAPHEIVLVRSCGGK